MGKEVSLPATVMEDNPIAFCAGKMVCQIKQHHEYVTRKLAKIKLLGHPPCQRFVTVRISGDAHNTRGGVRVSFTPAQSVGVSGTAFNGEGRLGQCRIVSFSIVMFP